MRVVIAEVAHETNTFCHGLTTLEDFRTGAYLAGEEVRAAHAGVRSYVGGMLDQAAEDGVETVTVLDAVAEPSGTIEAATYDRILGDLLDGLRRALETGPVDGVALALHGAGVAEGHDDLEGDILEAVRRTVGAGVPIVATLDLHGNVTEKMVREADALLGDHFYPHTDGYERGREAISLLQRIRAGQVRPVGHFASLPMMLPPTTTDTSPGRDINRLCEACEERAGILDCTFFHGFPYTDVPHVGSGVMVWADGDAALAREAARDVARRVWEMRDELRPRSLSAAEAVEQAARLAAGEAPAGGDGATGGGAAGAASGPVVVNETSDNPGGGAPGDGTHLLRAMLEARLGDRFPDRVAFAFIFDPETARQAHEAGVGATIRVRLGGRTYPMHGAPIEAEAYVKSLADGRFVRTSPMGRGAREDLGRTARLRIGGVDVIVASVRTQVLDPEVFLLHGIDVTRYAIVAVKSSQHFRAGFAHLARAIVTADPPGLTTTDVAVFGHRRIRRPMWPLDADASPAW